MACPNARACIGNLAGKRKGKGPYTICGRPKRDGSGFCQAMGEYEGGPCVFHGGGISYRWGNTGSRWRRWRPKGKANQ